MATQLDVSVVVCAYTLDRWSDLVAALDSIQCQQEAAREIIVVIDYNPTLLELVRARFPHCIVLENSGPRGLSDARNTGVTAAQGAIIAFLDDDAIATPDWITQLLVGYTDPQVVGVGGAIEPIWQSGRPDWFPTEFDWVVGCSYRGMPTRIGLVRNLIGANMSFRREILAAVGPFRREMGRIGTNPVGCEETELCIRIRQRWPDHILLYRPEALVRHRVPAKRSRWQYFSARCYSEGISKALVRKFVGANDGLSSERAYAMRTLPSGVVNGLTDTVRGDLHGLLRAGAIVGGLAMTTTGFVRGAISHS
ncbi:MAG: glycosyltransferase family 2 protein [Roseiflexaceae bacterium]|nr:glycosyltransferase family 2 protein [Roseiflexaceae bacterium]